jgi:hypothetical protein
MNEVLASHALVLITVFRLLTVFLLVRQMNKLKHVFLKKVVIVLALLLKWPTYQLA